MQSTRVKELSPLELAAWRGLLRVHSALVAELDRELEVAHGLPLTHYEVLLYLDVAPDRQLRMTELASSVLLSQSGVTRLVDRLERAGLVVREPCPDDRRGLLASITPAGRDASRRRGRRISPACGSGSSRTSTRPSSGACRSVGARPAGHHRLDACVRLSPRSGRRVK